MYLVHFDLQITDHIQQNVFSSEKKIIYRENQTNAVLCVQEVAWQLFVSISSLQLRLLTVHLIDSGNAMNMRR